MMVILWKSLFQTTAVASWQKQNPAVGLVAAARKCRAWATALRACCRAAGRRWGRRNKTESKKNITNIKRRRAAAYIIIELALLFFSSSRASSPFFFARHKVFLTSLKQKGNFLFFVKKTRAPKKIKTVSLWPARNDSRLSFSFWLDDLFIWLIWFIQSRSKSFFFKRALVWFLLYFVVAGYIDFLVGVD